MPKRLDFLALLAKVPECSLTADNYDSFRSKMEVTLLGLRASQYLEKFRCPSDKEADMLAWVESKEMAKPQYKKKTH